MNQYEFDKKLCEIRISQEKEMAPYVELLATINQKKRVICHEMNRLNIQLAELKAERDTLEVNMKKIGAKYWKMKHDLIVETPKV